MKNLSRVTFRNEVKQTSIKQPQLIRLFIIFHLTAFFVDRPSCLADLRKVFIALTPKLSTEQIEDRLDTILEDNNYLKSYQRPK